MAIYGLSQYGPVPPPGTNVYGLDLPPEYLVSPFIAQSIDYDRIQVTWKKPSGVIFQYRLLKNRYGFPVNENDGTVLMDSGQGVIGEPGTYFGSQYVDQGVIPATYHYYGFYVLVDVADDIWIRSGVTCCLANANFNSAKMMWDLIPEHFRTQLDGGELTTDAAGNVYLQQFLQVLGWGMDYLRTQYWAAANYMNNPLAMPVNDLWNMAAELGLTFSPEVPAYTMRKAVNNAAHVYRERGTLSGLRNEIVLRTSWDGDVTLGPNILLNDDQSQFLNNIDSYHPARYYMTNEIAVVYVNRANGEIWDWDDYPNDRRTWIYNSNYGSGEFAGYAYYSLINYNNYPLPAWGTSNAYWQFCHDKDDIWFREVSAVTTVPSTWEVVDSTVAGGVPATGSGTLGTGVAHPLNPANDTTATSFRLKNLGSAAKTLWGRSVARRNIDLYNIIDYNFELGITLPGRHHSNPGWVPGNWPQIFWQPSDEWYWWPDDWWWGPYLIPAYWTPENCLIEQSADCSRSGIHSAKITPMGLPATQVNTVTQAQGQVPDPGFESSTAGWTATSATLSQSASQHQSGSYSMEAAPSAGTWTVTSPAVPIETGSVLPAAITASIYMYALGSANSATLSLNWFNAEGAPVTPAALGTASAVGVSTWSNHTITATAPATAVSAELIIACSVESNVFFDTVAFSASLSQPSAPTLNTCGVVSPWAMCPPGTPVVGTVYARPKTSLSTSLTPALEFYDQWGALLGTSPGSPVTPASGSAFTTMTASGTAPSGTSYVGLGLWYTAAQATDVIYAADVDFNVEAAPPANYPIQNIQAIQNGLPVPWVRASQQWNPGTRYGTNDIVLYQDQPFTALRASTGALPPTNNIPTPEWSPLSESQRIRLAVSAYTSQNLTVPANTTVGVIPFVEWFDKYGNFIARVFSRQPGTGGTVGKPNYLTFDSFTGLSIVSGSGGSGSVTLGPWQASYYTNTTLSGTPVLTRTDASIGLWASGASPGTGVPTSGWSASWAGSFTPLVTGTYTFSVSQTGGGCRVIVNGATVVNDWSGSGSSTGIITLNGGSLVNIIVQYYDSPAVSGGWGSNLLAGFAGGSTGTDTTWESASPVPVTGSQPFTFSTSIAGNGTFVTAYLQATIAWNDASGNTISTSVTNQATLDGDETCTVSGTIPENAVNAVVTVTMYRQISFAGTNFQQETLASGGASSMSCALTYTSTGPTITITTLTGRTTDDHQGVWSTPAGNFTVGQFAQGTAWPTTPGTRSLALLTGQANTQVAVTFRSGLPSGSTQTQGLVFRYSDSNDYWRASRTQLQKKVAGIWTTVGTFSAAFEDNDRMMITLSGSAISVYRNAPGGVPASPAGYLVLSVTDAFNDTATQYGLVCE